jgi:hypothetical protein
MSDVTWNCAPEKVPESGLTVGSLFELICQGPQVAGLVTSSLRLELGKADRYKINVVEVKLAEESKFQAVVTGYVPGQINLESAVLTDGLVRIALKGIQFDVQSVLDPAEKEPKPFPPEMPVSLLWPSSVLVAILFFLLAVVVALAGAMRRRRRALQFKEWLDKNRTPLSPIDQLNKEMRRVAKDRNPLNQARELEKITREFLARQTHAAVLGLKAHRIARKVAGHDKKFQKFIAPKTMRLFSEFARLQEGLETQSLDQNEALNRSLPVLFDLVSEYAEEVRLQSERNRSLSPRRNA